MVRVMYCTIEIFQRKNRCGSRLRSAVSARCCDVDWHTCGVHKRDQCYHDVTVAVVDRPFWNSRQPGVLGMYEHPTRHDLDVFQTLVVVENLEINYTQDQKKILG